MSESFDLSMLKPPSHPKETYLLRLTAEQVDFLFGMFAGMRESTKQNPKGPISGYLDAKIMHLKVARNIAGDDEDLAEQAKAVMPEVYERLQKYVDLLEQTGD